ncbi:MAG TPA: RagB/SusD family nutrient uptake outer membrane protein [Chitinophaga sp.]
MQKPLLSALLLAALCACNKDEEQPTPPTDNTTTLEVQVYNTLNWSASQPYGTPETVATVQLFKTRESFNSNAPAYSQTTDANGKATFAKIDTGLYYIVARSVNASNLLDATLSDGAYIGYLADSLYQTQAEVAAGPANRYGAPGNFRLADLNGDGMISTNDKTLLPAQSTTVKANTVNTKRILIGTLDNRANHTLSNETAVNEALQSAYASFNKWHELQVSIDAVYTDDYDCTGLGTDWCVINGYTNLDATNSIVTSFWKDGFQIVSQLNRIIKYTGAVQDPNMTAAEKTLAVAKAKGLKGYVYLQLVTYFDQVPLMDDISLPPTAASVPSTQSYPYIVNLLSDAWQNLGTDVSVISATACYALLAKLHIQQQHFDDARAYCNFVLNNTAYSLVDTPAIFTQTGNKEIILKTADNLLTTPLQTLFTRGQFLPEIRLAEIQFIQAEAHLGLGDVQSAMMSLNKLLEREKRTLITYSADPGFKDKLREEIYANYKRHMRLEGLRFAALKRWSRLLKELMPPGFDDRNKNLPVSMEILMEYPNIRQNVGY